jgi:Transport and Golgi organisation 2
MCTLSFLPNARGYVVGMNRDEQITRTRALPPAIFGSAIYPHEPATGGTWLAINASGLTLAILNKNQDGTLPAKTRSRGEIIPSLVNSDSLAEVHRRLVEFGFKGIWPFRLLAISAEEREVCEWAWGTQLKKAHYEWEPRHWYSSGMSDVEAQRMRSMVVEHAWQKPGAGSLTWLRELHRSHEPKASAFSICVHRPDAATVSYSEIEFDQRHATFRYAAGSPCQSSGFDSQLSLSTRSVAHSLR